MLPFGFGPIQRVHGMSPHEAHRSFWLIRLFSPSRRFFSRCSQYEHLCPCRVQQHFIAANAGAEGPLDAAGQGEL